MEVDRDVSAAVVTAIDRTGQRGPSVQGRQEESVVFFPMLLGKQPKVSHEVDRDCRAGAPRGRLVVILGCRYRGAKRGRIGPPGLPKPSASGTVSGQSGTRFDSRSVLMTPPESFGTRKTKPRRPARGGLPRPTPAHVAGAIQPRECPAARATQPAPLEQALPRRASEFHKMPSQGRRPYRQRVSGSSFDGRTRGEGAEHDGSANQRGASAAGKHAR